MTDIFFISDSLALKIHQQQVNRFGGINGIRDQNILASALGAPRQTWDYTQDIYQSAAQYCFSIANNHPFLDGNKRTATACMLIFLVKNGLKPTMSNDDLYQWVIEITINKMQRDELAEHLRHSTEKIG